MMEDAMTQRPNPCFPSIGSRKMESALDSAAHPKENAQESNLAEGAVQE
jgi:hypothetical protein